MECDSSKRPEFANDAVEVVYVNSFCWTSNDIPYADLLYSRPPVKVAPGHDQDVETGNAISHALVKQILRFYFV